MNAKILKECCNKSNPLYGAYSRMLISAGTGRTDALYHLTENEVELLQNNGFLVVVRKTPQPYEGKKLYKISWE